MIYITGDTHGKRDCLKLSENKYLRSDKMSSSDYVIICGDFGFVWNKKRTDMYWLSWLEELPYTVLFVDGNHENFDMLSEYPLVDFHDGTAGKIGANIFHLRRGQLYEIDGIRIYTFGGGDSVDKIFRVPGKSWWAEEMPTSEEMRAGLNKLQEIDFDVDLVITHTCPASIFDVVNEQDKEMTILEEHFDEILWALNRRKQKYQWYFGHFHNDCKVTPKIQCVYERVIPYMKSP